MAEAARGLPAAFQRQAGEVQEAHGPELLAPLLRLLHPAAHAEEKALGGQRAEFVRFVGAADEIQHAHGPVALRQFVQHPAPRIGKADALGDEALRQIGKAVPPAQGGNAGNPFALFPHRRQSGGLRVGGGKPGGLGRSGEARKALPGFLFRLAARCAVRLQSFPLRCGKRVEESQRLFFGRIPGQPEPDQRLSELLVHVVSFAEFFGGSVRVRAEADERTFPDLRFLPDVERPLFLPSVHDDGSPGLNAFDADGPDPHGALPRVPLLAEAAYFPSVRSRLGKLPEDVETRIVNVP